MMDFRESFYDAVIDGQHPFADELRRQSKEMMETQLADRPELWDKLTPKYNPGCKRVIISDDYYPTLALPNVALETRPIHRIGSNSVSVIGEDGQPDVVESDYDLLVCATGFQTTEFMHPVQLTGRNGRQLSDVWHKGAQAYNGTCVEDMVKPNHQPSPSIRNTTLTPPSSPTSPCSTAQTPISATTRAYPCPPPPPTPSNPPTNPPTNPE